MNWAQERRLGFIAGRLKTEGCLNRLDLMKLFRVDSTTASRDIGCFLTKNPGAMTYNSRLKKYVVPGYLAVVQDKESGVQSCG